MDFPLEDDHVEDDYTSHSPMMKLPNGRIKVVDWSNLTITPVPYAVYASLSTYTGVVTTVAILLNSTNLRAGPSHIIMLCLSASDIICAAYGGITSVFSNALNYFVFGKAMCAIHGFVLGTGGVASIMTIAFLAISRTMPMMHRSEKLELTLFKTIIGICLAWVWSVGWHLPPLFWDGYDLEGIGTSCGPRWNDEKSKVYLALYATFCFFFPLGTVIIFYCIFFCLVHKKNKERSQRESQVQDRERNERENAISTMDEANMAFIILGVLFFAWSPYAIVSIYKIIAKSEVNQYVSAIPAYFSKTAPLYRPSIYFILDKEYQNSVMNNLVSVDVISRKGPDLGVPHSDSTEDNDAYQILLRGVQLRDSERKKPSFEKMKISEDKL